MNDILREMHEAGQEFDGGQKGSGIVGRIKIEFGFHTYIENNDFWAFWRPYKTPPDKDEAYASACDAVTNAGGDLKQLRPGIKITVYADVLSRNEPYAMDLMEFTPAWQEGAYKMIYNSMLENELPFNDIFYGQVVYKANPYHVAKGEAGKTSEDQNGNPAYPTVRVPVQKFANQKEAQDFVGSLAVNNEPKFSQEALAYFGNIETLMKNIDDILHTLEDAKNGKEMQGSEYTFPAKPNQFNIALYTAKTWGITTDDLNILEGIKTDKVEAPF